MKKSLLYLSESDFFNLLSIVPHKSSANVHDFTIRSLHTFAYLNFSLDWIFILNYRASYILFHLAKCNRAYRSCNAINDSTNFRYDLYLHDFDACEGHFLHLVGWSQQQNHFKIYRLYTYKIYSKSSFIWLHISLKKMFKG